MTGEVKLDCSIRASREELWEACSTRSGLEGWYADRVTGTVQRGARLKLEWPELGATVDLEVEEVRQNEELVLVNGKSRVSLVVSEGRVELTHHGLTTEDDFDGFRSSWQVALAILKHSLEEHPRAPRRVRWAARPAHTSAELAHLCFTAPAALDRWLGQGSVMGGEDEPFHLTLMSGGSMSGKVLCRVAGRDVALTWEEQNDSVLVLRTLPSPRASQERVVAICWSKWGATEAGEHAIETELQRALERLGALLAMSGSA
ncbi:MAG TPA: hypothetical protein VH062_34525 [Polyangiaceae bacterium]|jgi:uncharacterized protein YndB with AHSA1/START domain|nr:hypothetical protein [Polyangiaceae bacterium]